MPNRKQISFQYKNYPLIPIRLTLGDRATPVIEALLDSGGDFIVIPLPIAKYLQADLEIADSVKTAGGNCNLFKTNVNLIIGRKEKEPAYEHLEIFVADRDDMPVLIGRTPLFDDFEITFNKSQQKIILNPVCNASG